MILRSAQFTPYRLPLRRPWDSHHGRMAWREGRLIRMQTDETVGWGDCAPLPMAGTETLAEAEAWLGRLLPTFIGQEPSAELAKLERTEIPPATRCGIETALIDLVAQQQGGELAQWFNPQAASQVRVNAHLGALSAEISGQLSETEGYTVIKLKVGIGPWAQEIDQLYRLVPLLPPGSRLRLDANQAWRYDEAARFLEAMEELPIEAIEEPLATNEICRLAELQRHTPIPIALDESLPSWDIGALFASAPVKRLVLKPMVLGGPRRALALARQAHAAGMETVVTTTVDSGVGVWAAVHLAAALGEQGARLAHGLDTSRWLAADLVPPPRIEQGIIRLPQPLAARSHGLLP